MQPVRSSGILLPISSLPGPYGIGSLGQSGRDFVDFLSQSGQRYWQILPLVPPDVGNSPYMSTSAFAGNPYFIDLDELAAEGLLTRDELDGAKVENPDRVDYALLHKTRLELLRCAWSRTKGHGNSHWVPKLPWLEEYAQFAALAGEYQIHYRLWPKKAVPKEDQIQFHIFLQTTFYRQWFALKEYANKRGVRILGDLPIYLSPNSAECRAHPHLFRTDSRGQFSVVAGVPPDAFSSDGQLWGNPLYDWERHKNEVFDFWQERLVWCSRIFDAVRIDHFRAFHSYWSVPVDAKTAREGRWEVGPGMPLIRLLRDTVPQLELIAEDLGELDAEALAFVRDCQIPGMKVLVFAFDPDGESAYLPHNCQPNSVAYTGTHDTPTFVQWLHGADPRAAAFARQYLRLREDEGLGWGAVCSIWSCASRLAIAPMQDLLGLGVDARMNSPGTVSDANWSWRVRREALNPHVAEKLRDITHTYRRC